MRPPGPPVGGGQFKRHSPRLVAHRPAAAGPAPLRIRGSLAGSVCAAGRRRPRRQAQARRLRPSGWPGSRRQWPRPPAGQTESRSLPRHNNGHHDGHGPRSLSAWRPGPGTVGLGARLVTLCDRMIRTRISRSWRPRHSTTQASRDSGVVVSEPSCKILTARFGGPPGSVRRPGSERTDPGGSVRIPEDLTTRFDPAVFPCLLLSEPSLFLYK